MFQNLPDYLKELNYAEPKDVTKAAFQRAYNTDEPAFVYATKRPEMLQNFARFMQAQRNGLPTWIDGYPVPEKTTDLKPDQPLFVDLGGSMGHESFRLRERHPEIPGTVTVQEIPATLSAVPAELRGRGVDFMVHDFFTPQPIQGERRTITPSHPSIPLAFFWKLLKTPPSDQALGSTTCAISFTTTRTSSVSQS